MPRRFQFSLRAMFTLTVVIAVCCAIWMMLSQLPALLIVIVVVVILFQGVGLLLSSPDLLFAPLAWLVGKAVEDKTRDQEDK